MSSGKGESDALGGFAASLVSATQRAVQATQETTANIFRETSEGTIKGLAAVGSSVTAAGEQVTKLIAPTTPTSIHITSTTEDIDKPDLDERSYRHICLSNKMKVLLVSDPACDRAAAAVSVGIGSASDPEELPGLAHFLEHLLFLSSELYPDEDEYTKFCTQHGGSSNAFTAHENTMYYFDIQHDSLEPCLDRMASFFVCPTFNDELTAREVNAVDSEHSKNLQSDTWRLEQLLQSAADPAHPWSRWSTGSLETLSDRPERLVTLELTAASVMGAGGAASASVSARVRPDHTPALSVRAALIDFYKTHYSANLMSACVVGREPLDALEKMVAPRFTPIANFDRLQPSWPTPPYGDKQLRKYFRVTPVRDMDYLSVAWPLPAIRHQYLSKPFRYVSHVLGHEGAGSLLSLLRERGWASSLTAGERRDYTDFSSFEVSVGLTEEGNHHADEIVCLIFGAVRLVNEHELDEEVFREQRNLGAVGFRFRDTVDPATIAQHVAEILPWYPPKHVLSQGYLYERWAPDEIKALLACLTPQRTSIVHVAKMHEPACDLREKVYGTRYHVDPIDPQLLQRMGDALVPAGVHWPAANPFVPSDFTLACDEPGFVAPSPPGDVAPSELKNPTLISPGLIREDNLAKIWHKTDTTFRRPVTNLCIEVCAPTTYHAPSNSVFARLFFIIVTEELTEFAYDAEVAGCSYVVTNQTNGCYLSFSGYSHKLPLLIERVVERVAHPRLEPDRVRVQMEQMRKEYRNYFKSTPYGLARCASARASASAGRACLG